MAKDIRDTRVEVPDDTLRRWQTIVDLAADLIDIPATLIMRLIDADIEVFVSSHSDGNPYHRGDKEHFAGSGLYCETVINSNDKLLVPTARADEKWKNNPDIKLNMISYLGFPILLPDGKPFGTICILDQKENAYTETIERLIENFRDIIQSHLELIYMNKTLGDTNKRLTDYMKEIQMLRGIVPMCSYCKKIRDDEGNWSEVDVYIINHSEAQVSHSICPDCRKRHYGHFPGVPPRQKGIGRNSMSEIAAAKV